MLQDSQIREDTFIPELNTDVSRHRIAPVVWARLRWTAEQNDGVTKSEMIQNFWTSLKFSQIKVNYARVVVRRRHLVQVEQRLVDVLL